MRKSIKNVRKIKNTRKNRLFFSNTRKSKNNTKEKVRRSIQRKMRGGNDNPIHILYGLGHKNQQNQVVVIGISTNIINLYLKAMDFPEDISYKLDDSKNTLLKNMVIDTIELNNSSLTHTWQILDIPDIMTKFKNKTYVYTEIEPTELQYLYDKSSQITGVIGNLYSNEVNVSDGKIRTEDTNDAAYELFEKYEPLDFELNVVDQKLTITKVTELSERYDFQYKKFWKCNKEYLLENNYNSIKVINKGISIRDILNCGVKYIPYKINSPNKFKEEGFTFKEAFSVHPFKYLINVYTLDEIFGSGLNFGKRILEFLVNGVSLQELRNRGITAKQILDTHMPTWSNTVVTSEEIWRKNKYKTQKQIESGQKFLTEEEFETEYRYTKEEIKELGKNFFVKEWFTVEDLKDIYTAQELKDSGLSYDSLKKYFKIEDLKNIYTLEEFKKIGLSYNTLLGQFNYKIKDFQELIGKTPSQLFDLNIDIKTLSNFFTIDELYNDGISLKHLDGVYSRDTIRAIKGMNLSKFIEAFPDQLEENFEFIPRHFSFDEYYPTLLKLNKKDTLVNIFLKWYPSLSDVIKESRNTLTVKDFINLDFGINMLKKHYTLQEIWDGIPKSTFEEILYSIHDLKNNNFKLEDIFKLDGLTIEHYVNYILLYSYNGLKISLDKLLEIFKLKDVYDWINNGSIVYTKNSRVGYFEGKPIIIENLKEDTVNISLKDLLMLYKDKIPELLTVTTPEFLFYTGLYTYGELKPWLKELTGKREELFRKRADLCKKNWKRQTNLLCRYVPSSFPKNDRDSPSGHLDNTKEQYEQ